MNKISPVTVILGSHLLVRYYQKVSFTWTVKNLIAILGGTRLAILKRMTKTYLMFLLFTASNIASAKNISDRLVDNLSCALLSSESIFKSIRADAFDIKYHFPVYNWHAGVIANCWSLSRAQRIHFYLSRINVNKSEMSHADSKTILNMFRGSIPDTINQPLIGTKEIEKKINSFHVYEFPGTEFSVSPEYLVTELKANTALSSGALLSRNFKRDIEIYQARRFSQISNLTSFVFSGSNTKEFNSQTIQTLLKDLDQKKLTFINLRISTTTQHVVIAKKYFYNEQLNQIEIAVYDSRFPNNKVQNLIYDLNRQSFFCKDIAGDLLIEMNKNADSEIDAFIVDEDDRIFIEDALIRHYRSACEEN